MRVDVVNKLQLSGLGIHAEYIRNLSKHTMSLNTKQRVLVNQIVNEGAGSQKRLPYTLSLSCGTWGGNITTENVNVRNL